MMYNIKAIFYLCLLKDDNEECFVYEKNYNIGSSCVYDAFNCLQ